jgi:hypothetical protein
MKLTMPASIACLEVSDYKCEHQTLAEASDCDVLFGRGGKSYSHPGNRLFRRLIFHYKDLYESLKKPHHRQFLALSIVEAIRRSGAKFLRKENSRSSPNGEVWKTVSAKEACIKTSQALRDANSSTKKSDKTERKNEASTTGRGVLNEAHNAIQHDRNVVSPCNSSPSSKKVELALPPVPSSRPGAAATFSEDWDDNDHVDLETIHTLWRSLGGNRQQQKELSYRSISTGPPFKPTNGTRWSLTSQPLQNQPQIPNHSNSRQAIVICDWLSKEVTPGNELASAYLKPSNQALRQDICSSTRCSISSISMLEAGLFNADFEFDDLDFDTEMFAA